MTYDDGDLDAMVWRANATDMELIGFAAKAAGLCTAEHMPADGWTPLDSDDDAMELAESLSMVIRYEKHPSEGRSVGAGFYVDEPAGLLLMVWYESVGDDVSKATRRAITRAAAEKARFGIGVKLSPAH